MLKRVNNLLLKGSVMVKSQRGSIGIKEIAFSLGAIVVVGIVIGGIDSNMSDWLDDIWDWVTAFISNNIK